MSVLYNNVYLCTWDTKTNVWYFNKHINRVYAKYILNFASKSIII